MYRIMIIEDNEKIRNELCDFLGKNGYEALGPDDFEHTLDIIHKEQPDLLLLDLNLPVVSSAELKVPSSGGGRGPMSV